MVKGGFGKERQPHGALSPAAIKENVNKTRERLGWGISARAETSRRLQNGGCLASVVWYGECKGRHSEKLKNTKSSIFRIRIYPVITGWCHKKVNVHLALRNVLTGSRFIFRFDRSICTLGQAEQT